MKADELGQRTSFLLLRNWGAAWRPRWWTTLRMQSAPPTLRHMRSRWRLCSIPSCGRVSCGRSSISTHLLVFAGFAFGTRGGRAAIRGACCCPNTRGPAMTLFRGETMWNRRHPTYGMSWSTDVEVASRFTNGRHRTCQGGSVVLKTRAPAEAIICASKLIDNRFEVHEILVGRR